MSCHTQLCSLSEGDVRNVQELCYDKVAGRVFLLQYHPNSILVFPQIKMFVFSLTVCNVQTINTTYCPIHLPVYAIEILWIGDTNILN
jgi:hypothetical protein